MRGVNVRFLLSLNHTLFSELLVGILDNTEQKMGMLTSDGKVFGVATKKYWQSPNSDLGYPTQKKIIKQIYLKNNKPATVTVSSELESKTFNVPQSTSISKIRTGVKGNTFTFTFSCDNELAHIENPQIIYGVV